VPVQNTTKKKKINVGANDYLPKENESLLENKVFFSWKVSVPFQIIWFIFLLLFTIYTLLISFAPKIETIATFPMA
jgi:hypothetical protein